MATSGGRLDVLNNLINDEEDEQSYRRLIGRIRDDLVECRRLVQIPCVAEHLEVDAAERRYVDGAILSTQTALDNSSDVSTVCQDAPVFTAGPKDLPSYHSYNPIRQRSLRTKQVELEICHRSLAQAIHSMRIIQLARAFPQSAALISGEISDARVNMSSQGARSKLRKRRVPKTMSDVPLIAELDGGNELTGDCLVFGKPGVSDAPVELPGDPVAFRQPCIPSRPPWTSLPDALAIGRHSLTGDRRSVDSRSMSVPSGVYQRRSPDDFRDGLGSNYSRYSSATSLPQIETTPFSSISTLETPSTSLGRVLPNELAAEARSLESYSTTQHSQPSPDYPVFGASHSGYKYPVNQDIDLDNTGPLRHPVRDPARAPQSNDARYSLLPEVTPMELIRQRSVSSKLQGEDRNIQENSSREQSTDFTLRSRPESSLSAHSQPQTPLGFSSHSSTKSQRDRIRARRMLVTGE